MRTAGLAFLLLLLGGCASFGGRSRPFDSARLQADPGWVSAAQTPLVPQDGPRDCGPASLAMVGARWHLDLPHGAADPPLGDPPQGAKLGDLRDLARARGLSAFAIVGDRDTLLHELTATRPVLVGLLIPAGSGEARRHYEVVVAAHPGDDQFVTLDPASGWRVRSWTELDAAWLPAGRPALVVLGLAPRAVAGMARAAPLMDQPASP